MSAFMCSDAHISALVNAAVEYEIDLPGQPGDRMTPPELFAELVCENAASLRARYGTGAEAAIGSGPHRYLPGKALPYLHVLKLAQSYEYQSCECDGWDASEAKRWIVHLVAVLAVRVIHDRPEYSEAPWSI
jgi:hypothetical protein